MIRVLYKKQEKNIISIRVSGHANYNVSGKDIVCAAVSSVVQTTLRAILMYDEKLITHKIDEGFLEITVVTYDKFVNLLLLNCTEIIEEIKNDFKKNISIEIKEV